MLHNNTNNITHNISPREFMIQQQSNFNKNIIINRLTYETGLVYIRDALTENSDDHDNDHLNYDIMIMNYIERNFDLNILIEPESYFQFLIEILGFSEYFLFSQNAQNIDFHVHHTIYEVCNDLIQKGLQISGYYDKEMDIDKYGFPEQFNFNGVSNTFININGKYIYPYVNIENWDENRILTQLIDFFEIERTNNSKLYFHGFINIIMLIILKYHDVSFKI